jgi:hypothetical protein
LLPRLGCHFAPSPPNGSQSEAVDFFVVQALYHCHGFEVLEELNWPGGGPPSWPMWRKPRAA